MEFHIARRFYSPIKANIYYLKLKESGFNCFLSNENISTILPLSNGGVFLHVSEDQLEEAKAFIDEIDTALSSESQK